MDHRKEIERQKSQIQKAMEIGSFSEINNSLCRKRLSWLDQNIDTVGESNPLRKAFTLLLIKKMEIDPKDVPIVYEDKKRIVWRSFNFCPVLEACKELGLDTKEVCKKVMKSQ